MASILIESLKKGVKEDESDIDPERAAARWLADEYVTLRSMPSIRIMELINRCWGRYPDGDKRQLGQALLGVLEPLDHIGARRSPRKCARSVNAWYCSGGSGSWNGSTAVRPRRDSVPSAFRSSPRRQSPAADLLR